MNTEDIDSLDDNLATTNANQSESIQPTGPAEPAKPDPLYDIPNVTNEPQLANPVVEQLDGEIPEMTPVQNDMATVSTTAQEDISLNDMVSPTNLESNDISRFGQENIPIDNINQHPKPSTLESVTKSDEYNNIGIVPANAYVEQKPKRQLNPRFVLLVSIILVVLIGIGVFVYLRMGQNATRLKVKNIKVQIGEVISTNVSDYVSSGRVDSSCVTNFDEVQINQMGHYSYKIICDSGTFTGYIDVVDELAPNVTTKIAYKLVGDSIDKNDFIDSCDDISGCSIALDDEETVKTYLATPGNHEVTLTVKDGNNNEKKVTSYLIVTNTKVSRTLICTSKQFDNEGEKYNYKLKDSIGIVIEDGDIKSAGFTFRDYIVSYSDDASYKKAKSNIQKDGNIDLGIVSGKATYNDSEKQIIVKKMMTTEELTAEFETYPEEYSSLRTTYENHENEYECTIATK